tara:strand:- start:887 stop:1276 length:390 start_codon:yes stop_codon:yes gene_type:complete
MNKIELKELTLKKLKEIAKVKLGKGYSKLNKNDLIDRLCEISCCHGSDDPLCNECEEPLKEELIEEPLKEELIEEIKKKEIKIKVKEPIKKNNYNTNKWIKHLKLFRKNNPTVKGLSSQIVEAKKTYIK